MQVARHLEWFAVLIAGSATRREHACRVWLCQTGRCHRAQSAPAVTRSVFVQAPRLLRPGVENSTFRAPNREQPFRNSDAEEANVRREEAGIGFGASPGTAAHWRHPLHQYYSPPVRNTQAQQHHRKAQAWRLPMDRAAPANSSLSIPNRVGIAQSS